MQNLVFKPNLQKLNAIIAAHAKNAEGKQAIELYHRMQQQGIKPDKVTYSGILKACSGIKALREGRLLHKQIIWSGWEADVFVGSTLVDMYAKCGKLTEARTVFNKMIHRNVVTWGAMIAAYAQYGDGLMTLELFQMMQKEGVKEDRVIFLCILKACSNIGDIKQGRLIHGQIISFGLESDVAVGSTLVDMYAKSGSQAEAHKIFDKLQNRNMVSWSALITGYVQNGHGIVALELFDQMQQQGIRAGNVTFLCILKACGSVEAVCQGRLIHEDIIRRGLDSDLVLFSTLIDMYTKCGSLAEGRKVFDKLPYHTVVSWGAMITGYAQHGDGLLALELYEEMQRDGIKPDRVIFMSILKACGSIQALDWGMLIHYEIIKSGIELEITVGSALADMYVTCGCLDEAWKVFRNLSIRNVVLWGTISKGCAQEGHGQLVLELHEKMQQDGIIPDKVVFLCSLKACTRGGAIGHGRLIHEQIVINGLQSDITVGSSLVDMYAKCGSIEEAHKVFDKLPNRNIVSWGAMIAGYVQHGQGFLALELFDTMQQECVKPQKVTFVSSLKACGTIGALRKGRLIHHQIIKRGFDSDLVIGNILVDMYAKCGSLQDARKVLDDLSDPDVVSWGALITGYAIFGNFTLASQCLQDMQQQGLKPDKVIFTSILGACSHAGLIEEGHHYLDAMSKMYGYIPSTEHYNCIVDLLGRAGHLNEAKNLLQTMPVSPNTITWMSLLAGCRTYGNIELAIQCFIEIIELDPDDASGYVIMSNIYRDAHMWEELGKIQKMKKYAGVWKEPGRSWIEIKDKVHEFIVGDQSHTQTHELYAKLNRIGRVTWGDRSVPRMVDVVLDLEASEDIQFAVC